LVVLFDFRYKNGENKFYYPPHLVLSLTRFRIYFPPLLLDDFFEPEELLLELDLLEEDRELDPDDLFDLFEEDLVEELLFDLFDDPIEEPLLDLLLLDFAPEFLLEFDLVVVPAPLFDLFPLVALEPEVEFLFLPEYIVSLLLLRLVVLSPVADSPLVVDLLIAAVFPSPFLDLILDLSLDVVFLGVAFTVPSSVPLNLGDFDLPLVEVVPDPFFLDP